MRTAILILALLFPLASTAQTVTATKWQDYAPLLDRQSQKINEHTATIAALQAELAVNRADLGAVIKSYDILLRAILIQVCYNNSKIEQWKLTLLGLRPIGIGPHTCPVEPATYYVPQYLGTGGPLIPPAP